MENTNEKNQNMELEVPTGAKKEGDMSGKENKCCSGKCCGGFVKLAIVVFLLILVGFFVDSYTGINLFGEKNKGGQAISGSFGFSYASEKYYAVFLSNGQVYFGRITGDNGRQTVLENIYYLQVSNPLQQVPPAGNPQQPQLSLVKLGNELHGPKDMMIINNEHVIFIEELKDDGKVVEAISAYVGNVENK